MGISHDPSNTNDSQLTIGASWYPEMWPEAEWKKDLMRMNELGFNILRAFEFAWHKLEPAEGQYDFDWAIRLLDLCHEHGVQVMVGTPTAAPPAWLTSTYPEVLGTDEDGKRKAHGQRKHFNHHSRLYREYSDKIVKKMVEAFAGHPALHSWQIDNEMSGFDYGSETLEHFHAWLEARYGTVENLNQKWGLEFWSQAYNRFDQVPLVVSKVGSIQTPGVTTPL